MLQRGERKDEKGGRQSGGERQSHARINALLWVHSQMHTDKVDVCVRACLRAFICRDKKEIKVKLAKIARQKRREEKQVMSPRVAALRMHPFIYKHMYACGCVLAPSGLSMLSNISIGESRCNHK